MKIKYYFTLLFFNTLFIYSQQNICYESFKHYSVDLDENMGNGTLGSTYTWHILETNFQGTISALNSSGNQITIDWLTTPIGDYNLIVNEKNSSGCSTEKKLTVRISVLTLTPLADALVCLDKNGNYIFTPVFNTHLSSSNYTFKWCNNNVLLANTLPILYPTQVGNYTVEVTSLLSGCKVNLSANLSEAPSLSIISVENNDFTIDNNETIVTASGGILPYLYSINGIDYQESNVFNITEAGKYTIFVKDQTECNLESICFCKFNFAPFFTPNGDGVNDIWKIDIPNAINTSKVSIFNQYGKLIKTFNPRIEGWNGTLNNSNVLIATDYWFSFDYEDCNGIKKQYKSHFSLKR